MSDSPRRAHRRRPRWLTGAGRDGALQSERVGPGNTNARHDRLRYLHSACLTLLVSEIRLSSERMSVFLVGTSILVAGFVGAAQNPSDSAFTKALTIVIPAIGLAFCITVVAVMARGKSATEFWRSTLVLIESDDDFWDPGRVHADEDLDITAARARHWGGSSTRQKDQLLQLARDPRLMRSAGALVRDPLVTMGFWVPLLLSSLWLTGLVAMILDASDVLVVR